MAWSTTLSAKKSSLWAVPVEGFFTNGTSIVIERLEKRQYVGKSSERMQCGMRKVDIWISDKFKPYCNFDQLSVVAASSKQWK